MFILFLFFFKHKTAYEMRISDWSSDVCSSDLFDPRRHARSLYWRGWGITQIADEFALHGIASDKGGPIPRATIEAWKQRDRWDDAPSIRKIEDSLELRLMTLIAKEKKTSGDLRSEEPTSELQSLMRI